MSEPTKAPDFIAPPSAKWLREKILSAKPAFQQRNVTVTVGGAAMALVVREPTEGEQAQIFKMGGMKAGATDAGGDVRVEMTNTAALMVWATIYCARDEVGQRVFQNTDAEALLALPASDTMCKLIGTAVMEMLGKAQQSGEDSAST